MIEPDFLPSESATSFRKLAHWVRYARGLEKRGGDAGAAWEMAYCWTIRRAYLEGIQL